MRVVVVTQSMALQLGLRELIGSLPDIEVSADSSSPKNLSGIDVLVLTSADDLQLLEGEARPVLLLTNALEEARG